MQISLLTAARNVATKNFGIKANLIWRRLLLREMLVCLGKAVYKLAEIFLDSCACMLLPIELGKN